MKFDRAFKRDLYVCALAHSIHQVLGLRAAPRPLIMSNGIAWMRLGRAFPDLRPYFKPGIAWLL